MAAPNQVTHQLSSFIALNLGKMLKSCFFEKSDWFEFNR